MIKIQEIENAVSQLPKSDLDKFRSWFDEFDSKAWDRQFAEDVHSGRLDRFADQALQNLKNGRCSSLWPIKLILAFGNATTGCLHMFKNLLIRILNSLKRTLAIPLFILNKLDGFGQPALVVTIDL